MTRDEIDLINNYRKCDIGLKAYLFEQAEKYALLSELREKKRAAEQRKEGGAFCVGP